MSLIKLTITRKRFTMKDNNISPSNAFYTPADIKDLEERLDNYSGSEAAVAWTAAMMAWNLACKLVNESKTEEEEAA